MRETRATVGIYNLEMQRIVAKPNPINVRESSACKNQVEQCLFDGFDEGFTTEMVQRATPTQPNPGRISRAQQITGFTVIF